jgi:protein-disulfide isomerase
MGKALDLAVPVDADDHRRGQKGGRQLVVYGDFECPYTAAAMRDIGSLLDGDASFEVVFRHFPLRSIHPHAQAASEAAEAAACQDRFWEMHDKLFANRRQLEAADLSRYAQEIGLDLERFDADRADPAIKARIKRDVRSGLQGGVDGTPSLFIDGCRFEGNGDPASLAEALGATPTR